MRFQVDALGNGKFDAFFTERITKEGKFIFTANTFGESSVQLVRNRNGRFTSLSSQSWSSILTAIRIE
jgi:hypothetical protein